MQCVPHASRSVRLELPAGARSALFGPFDACAKSCGEINIAHYGDRTRERERETSRDPKWGLIGPGSGTPRYAKDPGSVETSVGRSMSEPNLRYDSENALPLESGVEYIFMKLNIQD